MLDRFCHRRERERRNNYKFLPIHKRIIESRVFIPEAPVILYINDSCSYDIVQTKSNVEVFFFFNGIEEFDRERERERETLFLVSQKFP